VVLNRAAINSSFGVDMSLVAEDRPARPPLPRYERGDLSAAVKPPGGTRAILLPRERESHRRWRLTKLEELETVISSLPDEEYRQFRHWFLEADWERWDREIEDDSRAGRLDFLMEEAFQAKRKGTLQDL